MNCNNPFHKRQLALVVCVFLVLAILSLSAFMCVHAGHEHDHRGPDGRCAICVQISTAHNLMRQLATALLASAVVWKSAYGTAALLRPRNGGTGAVTLVAVNVQLNN